MYSVASFFFCVCVFCFVWKKKKNLSLEYAEWIALSATSFQKDMFLSFCLQNVPVCHTENTACSQKQKEEAVNLASGGRIQLGLLALTRKWRLLATGKGISLPLNKAVLYFLRNWMREGFLLPHQQNKQGINHFAGCMLKRSAVKCDWCSGNR